MSKNLNLKTLLISFLTLAVAFVAAALLIIHVDKRANAAPTTAFFDDFSSYPVGTTNPGPWSAGTVGSSIQVDGTTGNVLNVTNQLAIVNNLVITDSNLRVDLNVFDTARLFTRYRDPSNSYYAQFKWSGEVTIGKVVGGIDTVLASQAPFGRLDGKWIKAELKVVGNQISLIAIDTSTGVVKAFQAIDSASSLPSGQIGFSHFGGTGRFDNVKVINGFGGINPAPPVPSLPYTETATQTRTITEAYDLGSSVFLPLNWDVPFDYPNEIFTTGTLSNGTSGNLFKFSNAGAAILNATLLDGSITTDLKIGGDGWLYGRYQSAGNYYTGRVHWDGQIQIWKVQNGVFTELLAGSIDNAFTGSATSLRIDGLWLKAKFEFIGNVLKLTVTNLGNGQSRTFQVSDSTFSTAGKMGLESSLEGASFANIVVTPPPVCVVPPLSIVSWWTGDTDASDNRDGNSGVLMNGALAGVTGKVGGAFSFGGIGDFVSVANNANLNPGTGDFTVDFWMRTTASDIRAVLSKRPVCTHSSFWDIRMNLGKLVIELDQDSSATNYNTFISTIPVNDGIWHYVALVRQGTTATLYIDGQIRGSGTTAGVTTIANSAGLLIGSDICVGADGTKTYSGSLDEIEYLGTALPQAQVQSIVNADSAGKCKVPTAPPATIVSPSVAFNAANGTVTATGGSTASASGTLTVQNTNASGAVLASVNFNTAATSPFSFTASATLVSPLPSTIYVTISLGAGSAPFTVTLSTSATSVTAANTVTNPTTGETVSAQGATLTISSGSTPGSSPVVTAQACSSSLTVKFTVPGSSFHGIDTNSVILRNGTAMVATVTVNSDGSVTYTATDPTCVPGTVYSLFSPDMIIQGTVTFNSQVAPQTVIQAANQDHTVIYATSQPTSNGTYSLIIPPQSSLRNGDLLFFWTPSGWRAPQQSPYNSGGIIPQFTLSFVDTTPPTAPTNLTATVSGGSFTASWTASTDPDNQPQTLLYPFYSSSDGGKTFTLITVINGATSYTASLPTTPGITFSSVAAKDPAGNQSSRSNLVAVQTNPTQANPTASCAITYDPLGNPTNATGNSCLLNAAFTLANVTSVVQVQTNSPLEQASTVTSKTGEGLLYKITMPLGGGSAFVSTNNGATAKLNCQTTCNVNVKVARTADVIITPASGSVAATVTSGTGTTADLGFAAIADEYTKDTTGRVVKTFAPPGTENRLLDSTGLTTLVSDTGAVRFASLVIDGVDFSGSAPTKGVSSADGSGSNKIVLAPAGRVDKITHPSGAVCQRTLAAGQRNVFRFMTSGNSTVCARMSTVSGSQITVYNPDAIRVAANTPTDVPFMYESSDISWLVVTNPTAPTGCTISPGSQSLQISTDGTPQTKPLIWSLTCSAAIGQKSNGWISTAQAASPDRALGGHHHLKNNVKGSKHFKEETDLEIHSPIKEKEKSSPESSGKMETLSPGESLWALVVRYLDGSLQIDLLKGLVRKVAQQNNIKIPEWSLTEGDRDARQLPPGLLIDVSSLQEYLK